MRRLVIHIGPHKTGTTYLQHCLFEGRKALEEKGVLYPASGLGEWEAHHRLAFALKGRKDRKGGGVALSREEETDWIVEAVRKNSAPVVILSSEEFFSLRPDRVQYLVSRFAGFDIRAVFYARRQDELFVSNYTQIVKTPDNDITGSIYSFLERPNRANQDLNMFKCVYNWERVLGRKKIVARLYDRKGDILSDFFENVVGDASCVAAVRSGPSSKMINVSPSLEAIEVMRQVKAICPDVAVRQKAYRMLTRIYAKGRSAAVLLSTADRFGILRRYRKSNQRLFRRYFREINLFSPERLLPEEGGARQSVPEAESRAMAEKVVTLCKRGMQPARDSSGQGHASRLADWWRRLFLLLGPGGGL